MPTGLEMLAAKIPGASELKAQVQGFIDNMQGQAAAMNDNQRRIEAKLDRIEAKLDLVAELLRDLTPRTWTTPILEDGEPAGVFFTNEKFPQVMLNDAGMGG